MITVTLEFETVVEAQSALAMLAGGNDAKTTKPARKASGKATKAKAADKSAGTTAEPAAAPTTPEQPAAPAAPAVPAAPQEAAPAAPQAPQAQAPAQVAQPAGEYSIEQVRARVGQLAQVMPDQGASLGQILQQAFNVGQLPDLDPAHYGTFVRQCEAHAQSLGVQL